MGVAGFAMIMIMLAFKCLRFSGLARFHLRLLLLLRGRVLRILECVAFCCVIQVISLSGADVAADERRVKMGISGTYPRQPV
jgi:hypothetical protein